MTTSGCMLRFPSEMADSASVELNRWLLSPTLLQPLRLSSCRPSSLQPSKQPPNQHVSDLLEVRRDTLPATIHPLPVKQSTWDRPLIEKDKTEIRQNAVGLVNSSG